MALGALALLYKTFSALFKGACTIVVLGAQLPGALYSARTPASTEKFIVEGGFC